MTGSRKSHCEIVNGLFLIELQLYNKNFNQVIVNRALKLPFQAESQIQSDLIRSTRTQSHFQYFTRSVTVGL